VIKINLDEANKKEIFEKHLAYFKDKDPYREHKSYLTELEALKNGNVGEEKDFFNFLYENYEKILIGSPQVIQIEIINNIKSTFSENLQQKISNTNSDIHNKIISIFDYTSFSGRSPGRWGAFQLINRLKLNVCPYCNRQYLTTIRKRSGMVKATLDHFWNKARHPYLSISIYNLIPCCSTCNSSFKGSYDFNLNEYIHPYIEGFDDYGKFELGLGKKPKIENLIGKSEDISFSVNPRNSISQSKAINYKEFFELEKVYHIHKEQIRELLQKSLIYNDEYIDNLYNQFDTIFKDKEDLKKMILGTNPRKENINERVLSKFIRDIAEDLHLL
jgi:hypothetical protein